MAHGARCAFQRNSQNVEIMLCFTMFRNRWLFLSRFSVFGATSGNVCFVEARRSFSRKADFRFLALFRKHEKPTRKLQFLTYGPRCVVSQVSIGSVRRGAPLRARIFLDRGRLRDTSGRSEGEPEARQRVKRDIDKSEPLAAAGCLK